MPTPRAHGGAALANIPLTTPGFKGLNKQQASGILGPEWATVLHNAVIDDVGRVASRKGWNNVTTAGTGSQIKQLIEYRSKAGTRRLFASCVNNGLYHSTDNGANWSAVTGTAGVTDPNMQLVNFNDYVYGLQAGDAIVRYNGTTSSDVSDVNAPLGGVGCAAFGRLWVAAANGVDFQYSALLDGSDWTSTDSGVFSVENVWTEADTITAMTAFNGALVVFGKNNIIIYSDGQGSALGIDPVAMYVVDVIRGTGCVARDSVQHVDGDVWFLSANGLQSLGRVVQEKSNPLRNLSTNVQDYLRDAVNDPSVTGVRAIYSPLDRFYLLSLPWGASGTDAGVTFVFDTRGRLEDGSARCMGVWNQLVPTAMCLTEDNTLYTSLYSAAGDVGTYSGHLDDGVAYVWDYESGWLDLTQQGYLLFPKRYTGLWYADAAVTVTYKWAFDFETTFRTSSRSFTGSVGAGEWGSGEWGLSEFAGGVVLREGKVPGSGNGQYIKLGASCSINNVQLAVQQLGLFCKVGRYK